PRVGSGRYRRSRPNSTLQSRPLGTNGALGYRRTAVERNGNGGQTRNTPFLRGSGSKMSWRTALAAFAVWALLFGMTGLSVGYGVMTAISCVFTTIVLAMMLLLSSAVASRWAAVWVLFIPYGLIGTLNIDLEGIFFDVFPFTAGLRLLSVGLLSAFASSAL